LFEPVVECLFSNEQLDKRADVLVVVGGRQHGSGRLGELRLAVLISFTAFPTHLLLAGWLLLQYRRVTTVCGGDNSSVYSRTIEKQGFLYHIIISLYATHFRLYQKKN